MASQVRIELIQHAVWLSRTGGSFPKPRSSELKATDTALKAYELNGGSTDALVAALKAWQKKAGANWKLSDRNKKGAVEELERRLQAKPVAATVLQKDSSHARLGLIYLCSQTTVDTNIFKFLVSSGLDLAGGIVGVAAPNTPLVDKALAGANYVSAKVIDKMGSQPPGNLPQPARSLWQQLKDYLAKYANDLILNLKAKFADGVGSGLRDMALDGWDNVVKLINFICSKVAVSAAPLVGGALSIASGLKDTVKACYERYRSYSMGKNVVLKEGHAQVVVDSLHRAMHFSIGKGLYDTMKGAASVAMTAASFGASAIVDLVIAGCEAIATLVHRIWETNRINAFCGDCRTRWASRNEASAIHNSPVAFAGWYRSAAVAMPGVSALVLASGMAGDKMQYLEMFNDRVEVIGQAEFDRGVTYLDNLKAYSKGYLEEAGYSFTSKDKLVSNIIEASSMTRFKPITTIKMPLLNP